MLRDVNGQSLRTMSFHLPLNYKKNKSVRKRETFTHSQTEIQTVIEKDSGGEQGSDRQAYAKTREQTEATITWRVSHERRCARSICTARFCGRMFPSAHTLV